MLIADGSKIANLLKLIQDVMKCKELVYKDRKYKFRIYQKLSQQVTKANKPII